MAAFQSVCRLPTEFGAFAMLVFETSAGSASPIVCMVAAPSQSEATCSRVIPFVSRDADTVGRLHAVSEHTKVFLRVHDACMTSEVFGSLKCDCKAQLDAAMEACQEHARNGDVGAVIYMPQEGRGIGLANKIKAYALQEAGADTVDANRLLELPDDARTYDAVLPIAEHLGIHKHILHLMTNNPRKVEALKAIGLRVQRVSHAVSAPSHFAAAYMRTKARRMHHILPGADDVSSDTDPLAAGSTTASVSSTSTSTDSDLSTAGLTQASSQAQLGTESDAVHGQAHRSPERPGDGKETRDSTTVRSSLSTDTRSLEGAQR